MKKQIVRAGLILACALLATAAGGSAVRPPAVVISRFALQSETITDTAAPSSQACAEYNMETTSNDIEPVSARGASPGNPALDPTLPDSISDELKIGLLKKKAPVRVDPDLNSVPVGTYIVSGCIFRAHKETADGRTAGRLGAHVVVLSRTETGFTSVDAFDVQVTDHSAVSPAPTAVAVDAGGPRTATLLADTKKLADRIVKKLDSGLKQQLFEARTSRAR